VYHNNGLDLSVVPELPFDFAFSTLVFQHIPSRRIIQNYVREVNRLLVTGALFKPQVRGNTADKSSAADRGGRGIFGSGGGGNGGSVRV
jgi:hypothetical protein